MSRDVVQHLGKDLEQTACEQPLFGTYVHNIIQYRLGISLELVENCYFEDSGTEKSASLECYSRSHACIGDLADSEDTTMNKVRTPSPISLNEQLGTADADTSFPLLIMGRRMQKSFL